MKSNPDAAARSGATLRLGTGLAKIAIAAVCAALFVCGCGRSDRPPLGTVHGTVTLDGKPLAGASVVFEPVEPARASTGMTDDAGKYELIYIRRDKGAKVGAHVVRISPAAKSKLPPRYNMQSELKAEIKNGDNTVDFTLTSK